MARRLRLITFDLDDTLWDLRPTLLRAEAELHDWMRANCPELPARFDREALVALRVSLIEERPELRHRISDLRRESMRLALLRCGRQPDEASRLAEEAFGVFIAARHGVEPFAGVEECLEELGRDYLLGVITNGNADVFRLGLGRHFRFAISAESIGTSKPDPLPFAAALEAAGVEAVESLHIGDHPEHDIAGARAAGMRSAWFNPGGKEWRGGAPADAEFRLFGELPGLVRALGNRARNPLIG
jgi:putative hydrolase of the HAD superfamily